MAEQNYKNHRRFVKGYHYILSLLLVGGIIIAIINIFRHPPDDGGFISSVLILWLFICAFLITTFVRVFPLKAQDRAIRAEESLRYFILAGKSFDSRLTIGQIAALRFAPDDEFLLLTDRAAAENLSPDDIKKSVKHWRSDTHRV